MRLFVAIACAALLLPSVASAQKAKDTLRAAVEQPISGLSYYFAPSSETLALQIAVADGLIAFDEKTFKYAPLLAKAWTRVDDSTLEFDLRDDVTWHDGASFSADDVVSTMAWLADPKTKLRFKEFWSWIERAEKLSPTKVRLITKTPTPYAIARLAAQTEILPAHVMDKLEDKTQYGWTAVGTGMYRVTKVDKNTGFFIERNDAYRHGGPARPVTNIKRINLAFIPDDGTQHAQFLAGNLEMLRNVDPDQAAAMAKQPGVARSTVEGMSFYYVAIDAKGRSGVKPLQDARVRKALMMAIDRKAVQELMTGDYQVKRPPEALCWKFQDACDYTAPLPKHDPDGAKKLLAEAGYPNGFDLEATALSGGMGKAVATLVSGQLSKIGVKVNVEVNTFGTYNNRQRDGKIQMMVSGFHAGAMSDITGLSTFFFEDGFRDYHGDRELQDLAVQSNQVMDPAKRKEIGRRMFDGLTEHAYAMPLANYAVTFVHSADVVIDGGSMHSWGTNLWNINWSAK
jgi:peptide/nickel transport system substrate-binding protein